MAAPHARSIAAEVLLRVERDAAFAAAALDAEIQKHPQLDDRDRALATELVYGIIRTQRALTSRLGALAPRGLPKDERIRLPLIVAAYQILVLERIPAHAAVDAAVSEIRAVRGEKPAGFANAVLRRLALEPKLDRAKAILESTPAWLRDALTRSVGPDEASALLGAAPSSEKIAVRALLGRPLPGWLEGAERGKVSGVARLVPRGGDLRRREGYREGAFTLQEEGAQAVALALGAREGERILDACSGRGQKTAILRERVGSTAELVATDLHESKLRALREEFERLQLQAPTTLAVDWTRGTGGIAPGFDRVLVDAPCTGTGTLRHRPEIAFRLAPTDPGRMSALAESILRGASTLARPGGRVVFAVCSVLREEGEDLALRVADVLRPEPFDAPELPLVAPGASALRLLPREHGTDGFFIASFVRRADV